MVEKVSYKSDEERKEKQGAYYEAHKAELAAKQKLYRETHADEIRAKRVEYDKAHLEQRRAKQRRYYANHKEEINQWMKQYYKDNRTEITNQYKEYHKTHKVEIEAYQLRIKTEVLTHYGNGKCACVKCGYSDIRALSIDHVNSDGHIHRKINGLSGGLETYHWLKRNNYPGGYQTLCMNCNFIKRTTNNELKGKTNKRESD